MTQLSIVPSNAVTGAQLESAAQKLLMLIEQFIAVVTQENAMLARGLPASLSSVAEQKAILADAFEAWVQATQARQFRLDGLSKQTRDRVLGCLDAFQKAMAENMARLEAAMEASRRRIDAVMSAIRAGMTDAQPYGANGKKSLTGAHTASHSGGYF